MLHCSQRRLNFLHNLIAMSTGWQWLPLVVGQVIAVYSFSEYTGKNILAFFTLAEVEYPWVIEGVVWRSFLHCALIIRWALHSCLLNTVAVLFGRFGGCCDLCHVVCTHDQRQVHRHAPFSSSHMMTVSFCSMECDIMTLRGVSLVFIALRILSSVSQSLVPNGQPVLLLFLLLLLLLLLHKAW